ncbi:MAG TPA: Crp/Fnr family transcriptional regulator [Pyrinomonadaceae bacterium]|nr:Crp/Fnr family transcriptional regulator [Pyrinomonadaceae bacterium]
MSTQQQPYPPTFNRIINALSRSEYERLIPDLEPINLSRGEILYQPEEAITHVYFPNHGTVSIVSTFEDGGSVEVGMVGNEGMFGVCVFLGTISTPLLAQVQIEGDGFRMQTEALKREFNKAGLLHDLLLRYTQAFITQIALTAACNNTHSVDRRLAKWLLMCQDRAHSKQLGLTHEFMAQMLGIRRAGVTEAAALLRAAGVITYNRGQVTITDRAGLERATCECYPMMKNEFTRLVSRNGHAH